MGETKDTAVAEGGGWNEKRRRWVSEEDGGGDSVLYMQEIRVIDIAWDNISDISQLMSWWNNAFL